MIEMYTSLLPLGWKVEFLGGALLKDAEIDKLFAHDDFFLRASNDKGEFMVAYGNLEQCFRTIRANVGLKAKMEINNG